VPRAAAWALYDTASTIYVATATFLFTPYFTNRFEDRTSIGVVQTVALLLTATLTPFAGALCDRTGRARGYLAFATAANVLALGAFGFGGAKAGLLTAFFVANVAYNLAMTFYLALLTSVAPRSRAGLIGGIAVGCGYLGTVLVLVSAAILDPKTQAAVEPLFLWAAAAFLVLALPCLLLVRDRRELTLSGRGALQAAAAQLGSTLRELPRHRALLWFLLGNFCLQDVVNTAHAFFADFVKTVFDPPYRAGTLTLFGHGFLPTAESPDGGMIRFYVLLGLLLNAVALLAGFLLSLVTDRRPLLVLRLAGLALFGGLCGGALFGGGDTTLFFCTLVVLGAFGLAGIWTAGRKLVVLLAPPERVGEYFGLYGITVKLSVLGSTVYGVVADAFGPKAALLSQSVQLVLGLLLLALVKLPAPAAKAAA